MIIFLIIETKKNMDKKEANRIIKEIISHKWKIERHYYHKDVYIRYVLLAEEYEAIKVLINPKDAKGEKG